MVCRLSLPRNLGGKSNIMYLIGKNSSEKSGEFFPSLFSVENFPRQKLSPVKIFSDENLYLLNTFFQVEIETEEQATFQKWYSNS